MNEKLKVLDLFSGIGGFSLGLERTGGFETVAFCEIDPYCRKVLAKHWPGAPIFEDVRELTGDAVGPVDIIVGGYPCQPFSLAGKRRGAEDDRETGRLCQIGLEQQSRLWPTPTDGGGGKTLPDGTTPKGKTPDGRKQTVCLERAVQSVERGLWPTPTVNGNYNKGGASKTSGVGLATAVRMWATPQAQDAKNINQMKSQYHTLPKQMGQVEGSGRLNPPWVEWLMGFPLEWTALEPSETPSSRRSRKSSGGQSSKRKD